MESEIFDLNNIEPGKYEVPPFPQYIYIGDRKIDMYAPLSTDECKLICLTAIDQAYEKAILSFAKKTIEDFKKAEGLE